tara:strand:- start:2967 stop:5639 length:2673 start_codon:yes stop_codon:yes gene_type:complete
MTFIFAVLFGTIGALAEGVTGFLFGCAVGALAGGYLSLRARLQALERRLELVAAKPAQLAVAATPPSAPVPATAAGPQSPASGHDPAQRDPAQRDPAAEPVAERPVRQAPGVAFTNRIGATIRTFFTTGNVVVKVGIVILFFGVSFLLKYAHDRALFPIEVRLVAVAAFGLALLAVGWALRQHKRGYATALQGGAVGVLYLTVFGAARLYEVLPLTLAFTLMLALVGLSAALAVVQNATALAAFGSAGGFLAPVLTATGQGSHVALFAYYALLNLGIFGIAWFKSWRVLNWLGFVFTFVIALWWGSRYYTPAHFATTEPFLVLFVLFYVAITVLFATRQPPRLRGIVDASLVFGVPVVAFALQSRMLRDSDFGLAYSSLAAGIFYLGLAAILRTRRGGELRLLAEAFLALGIVFMTITLPLALDGHWTAAAWSLEAAGIVWVGLRQGRWLARSFGVVLQFAAALVFVADLHGQTTVPVVLNSTFIGATMIASAGLLSAWHYARYRAQLFLREYRLERILLTWGLVWWAAAVHHEVTLHAPARQELALFILAAAASALALAHAARRLEWLAATRPPLLLLPLLGAFAALDFALHSDRNPLSGSYGGAWTGGLAAQFMLLRAYSASWRPGWLRGAHAGSACLFIFLVTWSAACAVGQMRDLHDTWMIATAGAVPAVIIILLHRCRHVLLWPLGAFESAYCGAGVLPIIVAMLAWLCVSAGSPGDPAPLAYLPLLNPLDLAGMLVLAAATGWYARLPPAGLRRTLPAGFAVAVLSGIGFIWFNAAIFRAVHHLDGVAYDFFRLWRTPVLQATLSIAWTVLGSALMAIAALKFGTRSLWVAGAAMLALVVVKLFTVDLADIGTVARIVSFMGVGAVLLVIGYFAPLPPAQERRS